MLKSIILTFMAFISCNGQINNSDNVRSIYDCWSKSFVVEVTNEKRLMEYQKENLIEISKKISKRKFDLLRQSLINTEKDEKIDKEYFLLEFSEGEIATAHLYFIVESNNKFKISFINIYMNDEEVVILNKSESDIKKLINIKSISDETLIDDLVVLTLVYKNKVSSVIGIR